MDVATSRYRTYRTPFHSCRDDSSTDAYQVTAGTERGGFFFGGYSLNGK
jgi:hypothetical protein